MNFIINDTSGNVTTFWLDCILYITSISYIIYIMMKPPERESGRRHRSWRCVSNQNVNYNWTVGCHGNSLNISASKDIDLIHPTSDTKLSIPIWTGIIRLVIFCCLLINTTTTTENDPPSQSQANQSKLNNN